MKQSKMVIVMIVLLIVAGWLLAILDNDSKEMKERNVHIEKAEDYFERGLFQKSIEEYDAAIAIKTEENLWDKKLEAYKKRYEEEEDSYNDYMAALEQSVVYYPNNVEFLIDLVEFLINLEDYESAYEYMSDAIENEVRDEKLDKLLLEVKYAYKLGWKTFLEYRECTNGYYAVNESGVWTYVTEDGNATEYTQLLFASSVGEDGLRIIQDAKRSYLIDSREVIQGILDFNPKDAGIFSEELVAIKKNNTYGFYNSVGEKVFSEEYMMAGSYVKEEAAVCIDEKWFLIDREGNRVNKKEYDDIKLQLNGTHLQEDMMVAKSDETYKLYKADKVVAEFVDIDIVTEDNLIAFCKEDKWGFIDENGKEVIKPTYEKAKSFSNGLAAVYNGSKWGFIDANGELVIDYAFLDTGYFNEEKCCMVKTAEDTWQLVSLYIKK